MIKKLFLLSILFAFTNLSQAQSIDELKAKKAELETELATHTKEVGRIEGELGAIQKEIDILSGWITGVSGLVGLNLGATNKWISSPNPTSSSSSLAIGFTGYANRDAKKYFWKNKLILNKAWQDIDIIKGEDDKLFDQGTTDLLNFSSLAGYKLSDKIALSGLAELNTSIKNFLKPGTFDIGTGATWTPLSNLVVVIHPLNYHIAWSADQTASSKSSLGCKVRADYQDEYIIGGRKFAWASTLTTFLPYSNKKSPIADVDEYGVATGSTRDAGLFEYTWLNTVSFQVWKGIGVGFSFGIRNADFEYQDLQSFYTLGLSYTL